MNARLLKLKIHVSFHLGKLKGEMWLCSVTYPTALWLLPGN